MNELLNHYQTEAKARLSTTPWLAKLQQKGLKNLINRGFPSRFDEDWKYTSLDSFFQQSFEAAKAGKTADYSGNAPLPSQVCIVNGVVTIKNSPTDLPDGVLILPLSEALQHHPDKIQPYLGQSSSAHGFQALNTAMLQSGVFIYLPKGVCLEEPLLITHWQDIEKQAVYLRHVIVAEENSQASIIEEYCGNETRSYFTNTLTEVFTLEKATIRHYKVQRESKSAFHIGYLSVNQGRASRFESHLLQLGAKLARSDIGIQLDQEEAECLMNGIYAPTEGQHMDQHTTVTHAMPNCRSHQDYKGILMGHSRAVFNGKVVVAKDAQHTDASQQNKNLLLSAKAEIDTKPQLEIFADDVRCSHGATVGHLDEDALFYLATRGIDKEEAAGFLIHAFAADNIEMVGKPILVEWFKNLLDQQLG